MTAIVTIRPATPRDLGAVDALLARSYPRLLAADYPPSILVTAVPIIARANPALLRSGTYLVAEGADGAILAAGGWTRASPVAGGGLRGLGHVRHVATDPARLREGLGAAILARAIAQATEVGLGAMACLSTRTAVPFYRAQGFRLIEEVEIPLRPGIVFPAVSMRRALP